MNDVISNLPEAALILAAFYLLTVLIDKALKKLSLHIDTNQIEIFRLLSNSQKALFMFIASVMALSELGYDVNALITGLGLTGFALGFALKDAISNLIAGIMIAIYKPCKIGTFIELSGSKGEIVDINLRYLTVKTNEGLCLIPNALILNHKLNILNTL
mgnify:CR=1 FL=1